MAHTRKINDACYFKTLCNETKQPGLYQLNDLASNNINKCFPNKNLTHPKSNYKNTDIENNLFNLGNHSTKCVDGNLLSDKKISDNNLIPDCMHDVTTDYTRMNLNNVNRGFDAYSKNFNLYHNPNGSHLDHFNNGVNNKCTNTDSYNKEKCYLGNLTQSRVGANTSLNSKDNHLNQLKKLSDSDNGNLYIDNNNNLEYSKANLNFNHNNINSNFNSNACNCE